MKRGLVAEDQHTHCSRASPKSFRTVYFASCDHLLVLIWQASVQLHDARLALRITSALTLTPIPTLKAFFSRRPCIGTHVPDTLIPVTAVTSSSCIMTHHRFELFASDPSRLNISETDLSGRQIVDDFPTRQDDTAHLIVSAINSARLVLLQTVTSILISQQVLRTAYVQRSFPKTLSPRCGGDCGKEAQYRYQRAYRAGTYR